MLIADYNPIGKTLKRINRVVEQDFGSKGLTVFLKEPDDPKSAPGKCIEHDFTLSTILFKHPELEYAKVVEYDDFYGETILRVVLPRKYQP